MSNFLPRMLNNELTLLLREALDDWSAYKALTQKGWRLHVVNQSRGRCYCNAKVITIPNWVFAKSKGEGYVEYYVAHELAHAMLEEFPLPNVVLPDVMDYHGEWFMAQFKSICPEPYWHYELAYKPKHAMAAGIAPEDF